METERRFLCQEAASVRTHDGGDSDGDGGGQLSGYAAVFYDGTPATEFELWAGVKERILKGSFDRAIKEDDVRGLFNHDSNQVLGRNSAGTLDLVVDKKGLMYDIALADTTVARDVREHVSRGDVTGSSFSFIPTDERWIREDDIEIREILGVRLFDTGPVTFPAYDATSVSVRELRDRREEVSKASAKDDRQRRLVDVDARMAELGLPTR